MRKAEKWMLACGLMLALAGALMFMFLFARNGFDAQRFAAKVSDEEFIQKTYAPDADFTRIKISAAGADVLLLPFGDEGCSVTCDETENSGYDVQVRGDTLYITRRYETENLFRWINVNLQTPAVKVRLPGSAYEAVQIDTAGGDVSLQNLEIGRLEISAASGDIDLVQVQLGSTNIQTASGDVDALDVDAEEEIRIQTASGDVHLENCDAPDFALSTASGDIFAELKSGKRLDIDTVSGDVAFPDGAEENGVFRADTVSGDVHVQIRGQK